MPDAGFDTAANFSAIWHPANPDITWSNVDADKCPSSGSLVIPSSDNTNGTAFQLDCMLVGAGNYSFGFRYKQDTPSAANCFVGTYSDGSCSTPTFSGFPPEMYTGDTTGSWQDIYMSLPSGTNSILVSCQHNPPAAVYFDQFYLNSGSNTY
jgi:hypothetical protein